MWKMEKLYYPVSYYPTLFVVLSDACVLLSDACVLLIARYKIGKKLPKSRLP